MRLALVARACFASRPALLMKATYTRMSPVRKYYPILNKTDPVLYAPPDLTKKTKQKQKPVEVWLCSLQYIMPILQIYHYFFLVVCVGEP